MKRVPVIIYFILCLSLVSCSAFLDRYGDEDWSGPPSGRLFLIDGGDTYVYTTACVLSMDVVGAAEMRFSNSDDEWSEWGPYAVTSNWRLVYGNGEKTVVAEFRSHDGLVTPLRDTIYFIDKTAPAEAAAGDHWGSSVSFSGDGMALLAGAPDAGSGLMEGAGAVSLFTRPDPLNDWSAAIFTTVDMDEDRASAQFGSSVALSADSSMLGVGAPSDTLSFSDCGTAFLYSRNGGTLNGVRKDSVSKAANGHYGSSVSLSAIGTRALIGASGNDSASQYGGRAYIYNYSGGIWSSEQALGIPAALANGDNFGFSVSLSGNGLTAAIGAYASDRSSMKDSGVVYIYTLNGSWGLAGTISPPAPAQYGFFGYSVSLNYDGTRCAIGARGEPIDGTLNRGAVYIYDRDPGWGLTRKVVSPDGAGGDYFGYSVSLSSDGLVLAVGSPQEDGEYSDMGAVYAFGKDLGGTDSWGLAEKFTAHDGAFLDMLGVSVSCSSDGTWIAAGAYNDDEDGLTDRGSVYIFNLEE